MQNIDTFDFAGKTVLLRVDFNVPLNDKFEVTDDSRIKAAVKTIRKIAESGAKVVIMSHLGRPKSGPEHQYSLIHIQKKVEELCNLPVSFVDDCIGEQVVSAIDAIEFGSVLLLENLRFYKEEEKGDEIFASQLAALGNVYVNDAFGTAHRAHASTAVIANYFEKDKMFGYLMRNEIESIDKVLVDTARPFVAVMGGAKVSSKISIIENVLTKVDDLIIGGGMTFTFIKAKGGNIGNSLVEDDKIDLALEILDKAEKMGVNIHLPVDTIAADSFTNTANTILCNIGEIPNGFMGLDIGPRSMAIFDELLQNSKTILWNGPMGVFEMENFAKGTRAVANSIVNATANGAYSLVGGGDSVAAVNKFEIADKVSYVSTGGGALLEYMEGIELPGVKAIRS